MTSISTSASDILLVAINAKYIHTSFGLRYLLANLHDLRSRATLIEQSINEFPLTIVEAILKHNPKIVGIGVYIWNTSVTLEVIRILKAVAPSITIILGGPELSYEWEEREHLLYCDYLVRGEGEITFYQICTQLLSGSEPEEKVWMGEPPDVAEMVYPYSLYTEEDIAQRVIYVEASRGCPFRCQFCLSALDQKVRNVPIEAFLLEMKTLLDRGVRQFKFVDRTFNLAPKTSIAILSFFLDNYVEGLFLHFEMVPDRFPEVLRSWVQRFPLGSIQFEVGIQTFDEEVAARIARRQKNDKIDENLLFLRNETSVHLHTDLIVGLPGEGMESFARGFDRLVGLDVQEIQVGILKRLPGAPIAMHTQEFDMVYSPKPPYEILRNCDWSFLELARMRRFARYWDLVSNSGRFLCTRALIFGKSSPFQTFLAFSDWLHSLEGKTHGISQKRMMKRLFEYLTQVCTQPPQDVAQQLYADISRSSRKGHIPALLRPFILEKISPESFTEGENIPQRQRRHML